MVTVLSVQRQTLPDSIVQTVDDYRFLHTHRELVGWALLLVRFNPECPSYFFPISIPSRKVVKLPLFFLTAQKPRHV